jgi:hypothetical protein
MLGVHWCGAGWLQESLVRFLDHDHGSNLIRHSLALHVPRKFVRCRLPYFFETYNWSTMARFAHWEGFQNYSDEVSARGNMVSDVDRQ